MRGQSKEIQNGQMGDRRFEDEGGPDSTVEVYMSEESEEGVTVLRQGGQLRSESCLEL